MLQDIGNYEIIEKLIENRDSVIYIGRKKGESGTFVIKVLKTQILTKSDIARYKQDYKTILDLNIKGITRIREIFSHEDRLIYIFDDIKAEFLNQYLEKNGPFSINSFLNTGIQLCETIGEYQKKNIIHRNLNPQSIVIKSENDQVNITGFGLSSEFYYNNQIVKSDELIDRLKYISPEQTGRMNRIIDYRTDFYSLGAVLYTMLTGVAPFDYDDPLELIYSHIAREPAPPEELNPGIPKPVSGIIIKLLSKNPDDRYQSAFGIANDLNICLENMKYGMELKTFDLGLNDISGRFIIPGKLFGREKEIERLTNAFNRISDSSDETGRRPEIILISGGSGMGKSVLAYEISKSVAKKRGYFVAGKYEQFRIDTPYSSIIQAFQKLIRQILTESNEKIEFVKMNLLNALGSNGKIITDIIPELELIIGRQPDVAKLGPNETRDRFNIVFEKFISAFTRKEHPVVLFLDDLHWADTASLLLIKNLAFSFQLKHLLIIGSYRENEINETHLLMKVINDINKNKIEINNISLTELNTGNITNLIINFIKCPDKDAELLAEVIFKKTGGNPFFVNEFLLKLYNEKLLEFDNKSGWKWNIAKINSLSITNNVAEFLTQKINDLPDSMREILKAGSCIGNRFDLETISYLLDKSLDESAVLLAETIDQGFINISGDTYLFNHDRIQEIAYSLVNDQEKPVIHLKIGKLMLDRADLNELQNKLFYITDQLNLGSGLINEQKDISELAHLNLKSGIKAKESAAYVTALKYFSAGLTILGKDSWELNYNLTLSLHTEAAEAAYLDGDYDQMERIFSMVKKNSHNIYDALPVYYTKMRKCETLLNYRDSIDTAFDAFNELKLKFSKNPGRIRICLLLIKIRYLLKIRGVDYLYNLPQMTDHTMLAAAQILTFVSTSAYSVSPGFFTYAVCKQIDLSFKYGRCGAQIIAFVEMAGILISSAGDIDTGYRLGKMALDFYKKLDAKSNEVRASVLFYAIIAHWKDHLKGIRPEFKKLYYRAVETGDIERIADSIYMYDQTGLLIGTGLAEFEQETAGNQELIEHLRQRPFSAYNSIVRQTAINLLGKCDNPLILSGAALDKDRIMPVWKASRYGSILRLYYTKSMMLKFLLDDFDGAFAESVKMTGYLDYFPGHVAIRDYFFYSTLARLSMNYSGAKIKKYKCIRFVNRSLREFKKWSKHAPVNNIHRVYIIKAEKARVLKKYDTAEKFYDTAIDLCRKNEYLIEEGIANEIAGRYYLGRGKPKPARTYLLDAYACFARWGAAAKLSQMEKKYRDFLIKPDIPVPGLTASETGSQIIDLKTVIKASQAISGEVTLKKLLEKMMNIVMENSGARKGFIILENKGKYLIEAEAGIEKNEIKLLNSTPVKSHEGLSSSIVHYVGRTNETLILNDASEEGDFKNDPYVLRFRPKSILCSPIISQGKLTGVLYFENNLSAGVFNRERLEILNILSAQMAISIENAKFYEKLGEMVEERTGELKKSEKRFKDIALNIADWIWEVDLTGRYTYCSEKVEECLGYKPEELIGKTGYDTMLPDDFLRLQTFINETAKENKVIKDIESWHLTKDGRKKCFMTSSAQIYDEQGNVVGFRGVDKDITERKNFEMKLQALMNDLSRSNKELEQFAYTVSHDLQEPLRKIMTFGERLKIDNDQANDRNKDYLDRMQSAAKRMQDLINGLLNYSRVSTKTQPFKKTDLNLIVKDVISDLEVRIRDARADIETGRLPVVNADELQMRQLFQNFIGNALKFHKKSSSPVIKIYQKENAKGYYCIVVEDNGIGIEEKDFERIFGVFQRLHGRSEFEGSGIGLAICKKIMERHGGKIEVESAPGMGTKFLLYFPLGLSV